MNTYQADLDNEYIQQNPLTTKLLLVWGRISSVCLMSWCVLSQLHGAAATLKLTEHLWIIPACVEIAVHGSDSTSNSLITNSHKTQSIFGNTQRGMINISLCYTTMPPNIYIIFTMLQVLPEFISHTIGKLEHQRLVLSYHCNVKDWSYGYIVYDVNTVLVTAVHLIIIL